MTTKRSRRRLATATLILLGAGGAPGAALADTEAARTARASSGGDTGAMVAAQRQRRVENAWIAEQVRAAARTRRG